ncbi:hypothetical protein WJX82_002247 [Trebouxia sp. C0006]
MIVEAVLTKSTSQVPMSQGDKYWLDFKTNRYKPYAVQGGATDLHMPFMAQGRASDAVMWKTDQQYSMVVLPQKDGATVPAVAIERTPWVQQEQADSLQLVSCSNTGKVCVWLVGSDRGPTIFSSHSGAVDDPDHLVACLRRLRPHLRASGPFSLRAASGRAQSPKHNPVPQRSTPYRSFDDCTSQKAVQPANSTQQRTADQSVQHQKASPEDEEIAKHQPLWSHPVVKASHLSAADGAVATACSDGMLLLLHQATGQLIRRLPHSQLDQRFHGAPKEPCQCARSLA